MKNFFVFNASSGFFASEKEFTFEGAGRFISAFRKKHKNGFKKPSGKVVPADMIKLVVVPINQGIPFKN
jgi:hypothetical protein